MVELFLNCGEIGKNIGVIKFEVIQNHCACIVVNKFGALVKKSAVVLIRFHYKKRCIANARRGGEVLVTPPIK